MAEVLLDGSRLRALDVVRIAHGAEVVLSDDARRRMDFAARWYQSRDDGGALRARWGWLVGTEPPLDDTQLVRDFVVGLCMGTGEPLPAGVVRATMASRVNVIANGNSGCRAVCADVLVGMLQAGVVPVVPSRASQDTNGIRAPLAHIAQVACGWGGEAWREGSRVPVQQAMEGLEVLRPTEKEALSLVNGATLGATTAAIASVRARRLIETAEAAAALSFEVARAETGSLSPLALEARGHPGGVECARRIANDLGGSQLCQQRPGADPLSIRATPAVLGAVRDALDHIDQVIARELNGVCDNPLVFAAAEVLEAGNLHAAPIALAVDLLKTALTHVATLSTRRVALLTSGRLPGLPPMGSSVAMELNQSARSLSSECRWLARPDSINDTPLRHEDHASPCGARAALALVEALAELLAIELICCAERLAEPLELGLLGAGTRRVTERVQERIELLEGSLLERTSLVARDVREGVFSWTDGPW